VRANEARIADDYGLNERIEKRTIQAVKIMLDCSRSISQLLGPKWWLQPDLASRVESKLDALVVEVGRWMSVAEQGISASFEPMPAQQLDEPEKGVDGLVIQTDRLFIPDRAAGRPASFNVPSQCLFFAGRSHTLAKLHSHLSPDPSSQGSSQPLGISG